MVKAVLEEAAHTIDRFDAEVLLAHIFHQSRTWLLAHGEEAVTSAQHRRYRSLVVRRARAEPVAYLIGETSFMPNLSLQILVRLSRVQRRKIL